MGNDYTIVADIIRESSGIHLNNSKHYLFESRLLPLANEYGHATIYDFIKELPLQTHNRKLMQQLVEAMTTNESMFFRDGKPFAQLKDVVYPEIIAKGQSNVNIWCSACSSGQEPYSLAIQAKELQRAGMSLNAVITATDIDNSILAKAKQGEYNQFEAQRGLTDERLRNCFTPMANGNWSVNTDIRTMVQFHQHNLMNAMKLSNYFDIVFCRYVLIYFESDVKKKVLTHIANATKPGGYLFLGSAETLPLGMKEFAPHATTRGIYVRQ